MHPSVSVGALSPGHFQFVPRVIVVADDTIHRTFVYARPDVPLAIVIAAPFSTMMLSALDYVIVVAALTLEVDSYPATAPRSPVFGMRLEI